MYLFYATTCLCFLTLNWYGAQVDALLSITEEALITSGRLLKEIEGDDVITTEYDLHKKLNIVKDIAYEFEVKFQYEQQETTYYLYDWIRIAQENAKMIKKPPLAFMNTLSKFKQLRGKVDLSKGIVHKSLNLTTDENYVIIQSPKVVYKNEFLQFAKNKYKLNIKERIGYFGRDYQYMQDVFKELYELFFYTDEEAGISIFELLRNTSVYFPESNLPFSLRTVPPQFRLFNTIRDLIVGEALFFIRHQYNIAILKVYSDASAILQNDERRALDLIKQFWGELNAYYIMESYEEIYQRRSIEVFDKIKPALFSLSRHFSRATPQFESRYSILKVFAQYVINEVDLNSDGTCKNSCSDYSQVERVFGCFDDGICSVHRKCKGKLWDCENINEPMYICSWDEKSIYEQRYKYIKDYKPSNNDCPTEVKKAESWRRGFYKCDYCQCKCEETETHSNCYFSLRPATSDIYDNFVIVGAGFEVIDHVVHLAVLEAKLMPNGQVKSARSQTIKGFNVTDYDIVAGKDFRAVTGDARTVCLDNLESPSDHLLTGLRLKYNDGYFKLEIRMTQFNYTTGKLYPEKSVWYSKDTDANQRPKINLDDFNKEPRESIKSEGCVQFTTSRMEDNIGQNTIPFIDTDLASSYRLTPLSGAGIILKKGRDYDFLGFQLVAQDVAVYL